MSMEAGLKDRSGRYPLSVGKKGKSNVVAQQNYFEVANQLTKKPLKMAEEKIILENKSVDLQL